MHSDPRADDLPNDGSDDQRHLRAQLQTARRARAWRSTAPANVVANCCKGGGMKNMKKMKRMKGPPADLTAAEGGSG